MKGFVLLFLLFTFVVSQVPSPDKWRTIDGYGNNIQNPTWGTPGRRLARESKIVYGDGVSSSRLSVTGGPLPNPRVISNTVHSPPPSGVQPLSPRVYTDFLTYWGQFIDHDLDLTGGPKGSAVPLEPLLIPVPPGDPFFGPFTYTSGNVSTIINTTDLTIYRSVFDPTTGVVTANGTVIPRQQITLVTSYLDGSTIYGSDNVTASFLRSYSGGLLKTTIFNGLEYAPLNSKNLTNENDPNAVNDTLLYLFGDVRGNENPALVALHTVFLREHNRRARQLADWYSYWTDEELYQEARRYVIALIQRITFEEYLPITVGDGADPYNGYNASVDVTIPAEFSTGAFRYGHSEVSEWIWRIDGTGNVVPQGHLHLRDTFFNSSNTILPVGIEPILLGMAGFTQNAVDIYFIDDLRNYLFGKPGFGGLDLASVNIQRGRDHGLPGFNDYRAAYGLPAYTSWDQINPDPAVWQRLAAVYASIDDCDVYTCGLAEFHNYSNVGETFATVINIEYDRFRDGDRFWYENNQWNATDFQEIWGTQLRDVILRNTPIQPQELQCFVMAAPDPCGKVPPPPPPAPVLFKHYDFNVTVQKKTPAHPYYGIGSVYGFLINGVEGPTLTMVRGNSYIFNIESSCAHSFVLTNIPETGQTTPGGYTPPATSVADGDDDDGNLIVLYDLGCANENHEIAIIVSSNYPNYIYYQCDFHTLMGGLIQVVNPPGSAGIVLLQPLFLIAALLALLLF